MIHTQTSLHQSIHQQQTSFNSSAVSQQSPNMQQYPKNQRNTNSQAHQYQSTIKQPVLSTSSSSSQPHQNVGRSSPLNRNISQTEFRIIELNRRLQRRPTTKHSCNPLPGNQDESIWWEKFASDFFEDDATLTLRMQEDEQVEYSLGRTLIPRFFRSYFTGGVTDFNVCLRDPKEIYTNPNVITLDCDQALIVTNNIIKHPSISSQHNVIVHTEGHLVLDFVHDNSNNLSIKTWRFHVKCSREYIDRSFVTSKGVPNNFFSESITKNGLTKTTYTYLKMCMIMKPMQELMCQHKSTSLDPRSCLRDLLLNRYNFKSCEEIKTAQTPTTNKRRKRKPAAATATGIKKQAQHQEQQSVAPITSPQNQSEVTSPQIVEEVKVTQPDAKQVTAVRSPRMDQDQQELLCKSNQSDSKDSKESDRTVDKGSPSLTSVICETKSPKSEIPVTEPLKTTDIVSPPITDTGPSKDEESCNDELSRPVSEEPSEKENNGSALNEENSLTAQQDSHPNVMSSIPEDREENGKLNACDSIVSKLPPSISNKIVIHTNGSSNKQNRRRSSERKETLREGLMRTSDFVIAMKDLKTDHPSLWRITTGNNLLQQFEPKTQNGVVLYENTNQYAGWNPEIRKDYVGVDVRLTQHTRNQITVERLLLNFQNIEQAESFYDKHFTIYLQILISNVLDPKFWESIENEPQHHDYFLTSRKIVEDIIKRHKTKLSSRLKLNEAAVKNFEKYPNLIIKPIEDTGQSQTCRACNTNPSTQVVTFGNRSYDLHSYKPVKVTSEPTKFDDKNQQNHLCDQCLNLVQLYSDVHHMGWKFINIARDKVARLRAKGKTINTIMDECLGDDDWMIKNFEERDSLWSKIEKL